MIVSTLWLFLISNPEKVSGTRQNNLIIYMWAVIGYFIIKMLGHQIVYKVNDESQRPKLLFLISQSFIALSSAFFLLYAAKYDEMKNQVEKKEFEVDAATTATEKKELSYFITVQDGDQTE